MRSWRLPRMLVLGAWWLAASAGCAARSPYGASRGRLVAGEPMPDVGAVDQNGAPVELRRYRGRPLVVYFYPKDRTAG
jgi:hypothetical protein